MRHMPQLLDIKILGFAKNDFELLIIESLLITKFKPVLNKQVDNFKLELF